MINRYNYEYLQLNQDMYHWVFLPENLFTGQVKTYRDFFMFIVFFDFSRGDFCVMRFIQTIKHLFKWSLKVMVPQ